MVQSSDRCMPDAMGASYCPKWHACHAKWRWMTKLCVKDCVCDKVLCERWSVTKLCITKLCVKDCVWQSCVWKMVWDKVVQSDGGRGGGPGGGGAGYRIKNKNPTQRCGEQSYLVAHPTNRKWVSSPQSFQWINPLLIPCKSLGWTNPFTKWVVRHQVLFSIPSGYLTVRHGFSMALIEIDVLPFLIAWWIFPWLC